MESKSIYIVNITYHRKDLEELKKQKSGNKDPDSYVLIAFTYSNLQYAVNAVNHIYKDVPDFKPIAYSTAARHLKKIFGRIHHRYKSDFIQIQHRTINVDPEIHKEAIHQALQELSYIKEKRAVATQFYSPKPLNY